MRPNGGSSTVAFNKQQLSLLLDWASYQCQYLGLGVPHLREHGNDACPCGHFVIDKFGDHLHCCQQHAGATHNAHEHLLSAVQQCFQQEGYATERKHVPHSRGRRRPTSGSKIFSLLASGTSLSILPCSMSSTGTCGRRRTSDAMASHPIRRSMVLLDAAVKEKLATYADDYDDRLLWDFCTC